MLSGIFIIINTYQQYISFILFETFDILFVLYLIFAANDLGALKVVTSIIAIVASLLSLGWLYLTGEFKRRRSLWMVTGFIGIALCVLVSLLLGFPGPSIV